MISTPVALLIAGTGMTPAALLALYRWHRMRLYRKGAPVKRPGEVQIESRPSGSHVLSVRLPDEMAEELLAVVSGRGTTVSAVVREVIGRYLGERRRMAWLDEHRHELKVVPGSGRTVPGRAIPSSLSLVRPRTFACPHMSVGPVVSASCGTCGPLEAVA